MNEVPYVGEKNTAPLTKLLANARSKRVAPYLTGRVLELGCGSASLLESEEVCRAISAYTGVEALESSIQELESKYPAHSFISFDLDSTTWPVKGKFDCVLALAVIEHLWNLKSFFTNLGNILADDGLFVLTTPTPYGNHIILRSLGMVGLVRKDVIDDHVTIFNKKLFKHICNEFGYKIEHYNRFQLGGNQLVVLRKASQV